MKINDFLFGAVLFALAVMILVHVRVFPNIPGQKIGPAAFPALLASLLAVCSMLLMIRGFAARHAGAWVSAFDWVKSPAHVISFSLAVGGLLLYVAFSEKLGFIPSGILLLAPLFVNLRIRPMTALPLALVITLVIHFLFYKLLRVPLPWGVLESIAW